MIGRIITWIVVYTVLCFISYLAAALVFTLRSFRHDPTIIIHWDRARFKQEAKRQLVVAPAMEVLFYCAFWWTLPFVTLIWIHHRFILKNKKATFANPYGKDET